MEQRPPAIFLMGPTASGKTDVAVELVGRLPLEIVSVDSALVYRGMDIGTAKPTAEVLVKAPHRLIDIVDPADAYSAARFRDDALREMQQITAAGRVPLLVGGTMLYFQALEQGLSDLPSADADVRARLTAQAAEQGWAALHARLQEVDPDAAARIHPNDPQRIQRALEVYEVSGQPMSAWLARQRGTELPYRAVKAALAREDREALGAAIEARFHRMLDQGFVDEVQRLRERGDLHRELPSMRAVGYRQVWDYLDGNLSYPEMVERGVIATRQLAKRQLTWLRGWEGLARFPAGNVNVISKLLNLLVDQLGQQRIFS